MFVTPDMEAEIDRVTVSELKIALASKVREAIELARRIEKMGELTEASRQEPVRVDQVLAAFPEYLHGNLRVALRKLR